MAIPRGAVSLSAVCDCGISWSFSLPVWSMRLSTSQSMGVLGVANWPTFLVRETKTDQ